MAHGHISIAGHGCTSTSVDRTQEKRVGLLGSEKDSDAIVSHDEDVRHRNSGSYHRPKGTQGALEEHGADIMNVEILPNFLEIPDWIQSVTLTERSSRWKFDGLTQDEQGIKFWYLDLSNEEFFTKKMFDKICRDTNINWRLHRVYANGQTHGLPGDLHQDAIGEEPGRYFTLLYYSHGRWEPQWGGHTMFSDPVTEQVLSVYPTPNTAVFFDSTILHAGLDPTRHCRNLRVTVAFKLERP
jgi:hypothetical protein